MSNLPTGTVTFLFTDIEGSTRLWERYPDAMPAALERHNTILHQAVAGHDGAVFRTVGDAFCTAFAEALPAVAAALAAQRALYAEPWGAIGALRVRMALHTSPVDLRDDDYLGPPLNRVARLLVAGHGGQTLLCRVTQAQVRDELPPDVALRDLGEHRLRDLTQPEQIFQLVAADLPDDFPALKTLTNQAAVPKTGELPESEAYITRQQRLPGMPAIDFDAVLKKERERQQRKTRKGKTKDGGKLL